MMTTNLMPATANNDAELVGGTLAGNRDAFGQIVSRYQSLICSLAYSATGSLGQSEDLAQETFITAWKHLGHLRERAQTPRLAVRNRPQPHQQFSPPRRPRTDPRSRATGKCFRIPSPNHCPPTKPSATRNRRFSGVRSNAFRKFTASRSFCFTANINPSKRSRKSWI